MPANTLVLPISRNWIVPPDVLVAVLVQRLEQLQPDVTIRVNQADLDAVAGKFVVDGFDGEELLLTIGHPNTN